MNDIVVPQLLVLPPKLWPVIEKFNDYRFFLVEGGRGSGKTQGIGRFLLYLAEKKKIRVVCGRETQSTIEDSVYKCLVDLIKLYQLNFDVKKTKIISNVSGSEIVFKGFREQGSVNIKGLEGVDILWIDEAEAITKQTLDIIIPTIRKERSRVFFTMNRKLPNDPVYDFGAGNDKCLHITINYFDNPFCSNELIDEAKRCQATSEVDYRHIWLGEPLDMSDNLLFSAKSVAEMSKIEALGDVYRHIRVMGIDFAAQGGDFCCASILDKCSPTQWQLQPQIAWQDADPMSSIGRIVELMGKYHPDFAILDCGGMGFVVHARLREMGVRIDAFDGATNKGVPFEYANARAYGYYMLAEYLRNRQIIADKNDTLEKELLSIRYKYQSNGKRIIESKADMRAKGIKSPDRADSLMMAVYAIKANVQDSPLLLAMPDTVKRINTSRW